MSVKVFAIKVDLKSKTKIFLPTQLLNSLNEYWHGWKRLTDNAVNGCQYKVYGLWTVPTEPNHYK